VRPGASRTLGGGGQAHPPDDAPGSAPTVRDARSTVRAGGRRGPHRLAARCANDSDHPGLPTTPDGRSSGRIHSLTEQPDRQNRRHARRWSIPLSWRTASTRSRRRGLPPGRSHSLSERLEAAGGGRATRRPGARPRISRGRGRRAPWIPCSVARGAGRARGGRARSRPPCAPGPGAPCAARSRSGCTGCAPTSGAQRTPG
jgi:hypothetical protein